MENKKNIYQRMVEVQKKVQTVFKNETVKMNENDKGYKAVTHDDVAAALHLPLAECGVFMLPEIQEYQNSTFDKQNKYGNVTTWYRTDLKIKVKWINVDKPEEFIESHGASFALDTSDKSFAKAYSLALKIVLLKVHLLESRDNEEQRPFDELNNKSKDELKNLNQNSGYKPNNQNKNQSAPPQKQNNQNTKPQSHPTFITEDQHETIANLMIRHSLDGIDIENFFLTGFNVKPDQVTFAQADYLIKMLSVDMFTSLDLKLASEDLKTKREARNQDPADFVIDAKVVGPNSPAAGKKVRELAEPVLKSLIDSFDKALKENPQNPIAKELFEASLKIKAFLKSVGV